MTSADFLQFVVTTHFFRIRLLDASARPPRVLTHSFPLYLPYLPQMIPCSYWTLALLGVLSSPGALYMVSVRQARVLPPSFFRFRLTTDTLDLGYILPTAGRIRDFHPLERALTGRTSKIPPEIPAGFFRLSKILFYRKHCFSDFQEENSRIFRLAATNFAEQNPRAGQCPAPTGLFKQTATSRRKFRRDFFSSAPTRPS